MNDADDPRRVLLVDDDPTLVGALRETLRRKLPGAQVETCTSAERALARVAASEYEVVVSDILMPGVHGLGLLQRVRELRPETVVVLVTGADDHSLAVAALRGGAYDFIFKPVDADYFTACVARAMETRRLRREVERQQVRLQRHADELEHIVEERTRELRVAHRLKDEFLATVSHELRTPLTAILGWARLLATDTLDDAVRAQGVDAIARNARAQARLIDDLLDVSRIVLGKLRLDVQTVSAQALVEGAVASVLPAAQAKSIEVSSNVEDVGPLVGDPERLGQVLWNLLSNAIKFTPFGGTVRLTLRGLELEGGARQVEIEVVDSGQGITPELLPFVFDRFRQGQPSLPVSRRGLGLGLAITRHIVELHGGTVAATSEGSGHGACFTVRLPQRSEGREARTTMPEALSQPLPSAQALASMDRPARRSG